MPCESRRVSDVLSALNEWLVRRHALGDSPVVIIDEAQAISLRTLDRLRMLLNLETPGSKLLQVVLAGQPELDEKLRRPELRQLHQRVMFRCSLASLSMEETSEYIKSRLARAGLRSSAVFTEDLAAVHLYAQGTPRVINLLCEHALIAGYSDGEPVITPETIRHVATIFDLKAYSAIASTPEELPAYGELIPAPPQKPRRHSLKSAALAEFIEQANAAPRLTELTEIAFEPRPVPVVPLEVPVALAAVAAPAETPKGISQPVKTAPQVSPEPFFQPRQPEPKVQGSPQPAMPTVLDDSPTNGKHSGVANRVVIVVTAAE